jgi:hypothetical protein
MVVATHGPDTCAAVVPKVQEVAMAGFQQIDEAAKKLAPNAHVINQLSRDIHLMDWNTVVVNPVITLQEAMGTLQP